MRILMLAQFYLPTIGGEEQQVRTLSLQLASRGHHVALATLWHQGLPEFERKEGINIYRVKGSTQRFAGLFTESKRRHAPPFPDPELMLALRRVVEAEQPDIVHAHNWLVRSFAPLKRWSKAPLVLSLHDYSLVCAKKTLMYRNRPCSGPELLKCATCAGEHYGTAKGVPIAFANALMERTLRRAVDMYLPVSAATAAGSGLPGSGLPYQVMPNIVPEDDAAPDDAAEYLAQLPPGEFMLFVGDLRRYKGVGVLLRAYATLRAAPPLVLIGRECPDTPDELPPNVTMLKSWPHHAVMAAWRRSSIALAPSVWPEPFGIVVLEAMLAGKPVVGSRIGGIADIVVEGETGLLVPPGDPVALGAAMQRLIDDPALRGQMSRAALERIKSYRGDAIVPGLERIYRALLSPTSDMVGSLEAAGQLMAEEGQ